MKESDKIVAQCFDDWRRSNIRLKVIELQFYNLLTDEHLKHFSEETRQLVKSVNQMNDIS